MTVGSVKRQSWSSVNRSLDTGGEQSVGKSPNWRTAHLIADFINGIDPERKWLRHSTLGAIRQTYFSLRFLNSLLAVVGGDIFRLLAARVEGAIDATLTTDA